jgi:hypothetical protein
MYWKSCNASTLKFTDYLVDNACMIKTSGQQLIPMLSMSVFPDDS